MAEQETRIEGWKLYFELCKHLTTLNAGSILLIITFLEKLFNNSKSKWLIVVAFSLFVLSMIASVMAMLGYAASVRDRGQYDKFSERYDKHTLYAGMSCFIVGIITIIIFAIINLYG